MKGHFARAVPVMWLWNGVVFKTIRIPISTVRIELSNFEPLGAKEAKSGEFAANH
jgi:hypothetical protein